MRWSFGSKKYSGPSARRRSRGYRKLPQGHAACVAKGVGNGAVAYPSKSRNRLNDRATGYVFPSELEVGNECDLSQ